MVDLRIILFATPILDPFDLSLLVVVVVIITVFCLFWRVMHHVRSPSSLTVQRLELLVQILLGRRSHVVALRVTIDCILTILEKLLLLRNLLRLSRIVVDALVLSHGYFVVFDKHILVFHI